MVARKWGAEAQVNTSQTGNQVFSDVAHLSGGGYVIVWQDDAPATSIIRAQIFDAAGNKLGAELEIAAPATSDRSQPRVAGLASGGFGVVWQQADGANNRIECAIYNASGTLVRSQTALAASGLDSSPDIAADGDGIAVTWTDPDGDFDVLSDPTPSSDVLIRRFDASGSASAVVLVNSIHLPPPGDETDRQSAIDVSAQGTAVAWRSSITPSASDISLAIYDASGTRVVDEMIASQTAMGFQEDPAVAWLANGLIAVVWTDRSETISGVPSEIRARLFTIGGAPLVDELLINTSRAGTHEKPAIAALANGGFAVAWSEASSFGIDSSGSSIKLQLIDGTGSKDGATITVNTTTALDQDSVQITALADGRLAVSWTDLSSGTADIRSQIIDPRDGIVDGTAGNDLLYGHDALGDIMSGGGGSDTFWGLGGGDQIHGAEGGDTVNGGKGDDAVYGGADLDDLRGNSGEDYLSGDLGNDVLRGGNHDDELLGGEGTDTLVGGAGGDLLNGGNGTDTASYVDATAAVTAALDGSLTALGEALGDSYTAIESLTGSAFDDTLRGNSAINTMDGRGGNDIIDGGAGSDRLIGGAGNDTITSGLGNDTYVITTASEAPDILTDFSSSASGNNDKFELKSSAFGNLAAGTILSTIFQNNGTSTPSNGTIRFIYDSTTQQLFYDSDGSGGTAAILLATLQTGATMLFNDILIVA